MSSSTLYGYRSRFRRAYQAIVDFFLLLDRMITAPVRQQDHTFLSNTIKFSGETDRAQPEYVHIEGFVSSTSKLILFLILSLTTAGILPLICRWKPSVWAFLARKRASNFRDAEYVLLRGQDGLYVEVPITTIRKHGEWIAVNESPTTRYFEYRKQRYVYSDMFSSFQRQVAKLKGTFSEIHEMRYGHTASEASSLLQIHGPNEIGIDLSPLSKMIADKMTHPFYIFQMFSVAVWLYIQYTTYAILILILSVSSITWEIYSARKNDQRLRDMTHQTAVYPVMRDGVLVHLDFKDLVVGDVIVLSADPDTFVGQQIACDLALIQGECVMDESSLTGESIPAVKVPFPKSETDSIQQDKDKGHILFCGSTLIELKPKPAPSAAAIAIGVDVPVTTTASTRNSSVVRTSSIVETSASMNPNDTSLEMVLAIVMATGFSSSKGELFRSILFPVFIDLKFQKDSYKFLFMLGMLAIGAIIFRIKELMASGETLLLSILGCLDLITIAVPPALPLMLTVGVGFAMSRLKQSGIFCINPDRINYAGRVNVMCWDKTGTLTVPHLHFSGINVVYHYRESQSRAENATPLIAKKSSNHSLAMGILSSIPQFSGLLRKIRAMDHSNPFSLEHCMVTCHTLHQQDGQLLGHSLDVEMLKETEWSMSSTPNTIADDVPTLEAYLTPPIHDISGSINQGMYIYKRFRFDSQLQRTSVIASPVDSAKTQWYAYAKGSPESIRQICTMDSIPSDFNAVCHEYSIQGYYVIACAARLLSPSNQSELANIQRKHIERNMTFLGFILFENPIKQESFGVIQSLKDARIRSVIITGDNALTAVHVSRKLGLCQDHVLLIDVHGGTTTQPQVMFMRIPSESSLDAKPDYEDNSSTAIRIGGSKAKEMSSSLSSLQVSKSSTIPRVQSFPMLPRQRQNSESDPTSIFFGSSNLQPEWHMIEELVSYLSRQHGHDEGNQIEIAMTGAAMEVLAEKSEPSFLKWLVGRARIFSRTKPTQKTWIIEQMIIQGKCVAMCGDGTNDCGALKAAHVGVALSEAEASIVAPFTSAKKKVTDIPLVFREGRCAIETSFIAFKFMTVYPVIQFTLAMAMHQYGTVMSNNQYLFDDTVIVTALALLMLYTRPQSHLTQDRPTDNLFNPLILGSIIGQIGIFLSYFFTHVAMFIVQPWYCSLDKAISKLDSTTFLPIDGNLTNPDNYPCYPIFPDTDTTLSILIKSYENTGIWLFTHVAFAIVALAVSISTRYRLPVWTNTYFTSYWSFLFVCLSGALLFLTNQRDDVRLPDPNQEYDSFLSYLFTVQPGIPISFRTGAFFLLLLYGILAIVWEVVIVDRYLRRYATLIECTYEHEQDVKRDKSVGLMNTSMMNGPRISTYHQRQSSVNGLEDRQSLLDPLQPPEGFELKPTYSGRSSLNDFVEEADIPHLDVHTVVNMDMDEDDNEEVVDTSDAAFLITNSRNVN